MTDQASALRKKLASIDTNENNPITIGVISGKGGVGKSNISLNFSIALAKYGKKVLLFDMDIGMGNIDILLGITTHHSISDLFNSNLSITDLLVKGPEGIDYIAGGNGLSSLFKLSESNSEYLTQQLQLILNQYDYVMFDMGAGMSEENVKFLMAMDEIFVITTPEPTSITDAYSAMKYLCMFDHSIPFNLLVNRAQSEAEGIQTFKRLKQVVSKFLSKEISLLGVLSDDKTVPKAVSHQVPFILYSPKAMVSKSLYEMMTRYVDKTNDVTSNNQSFISKLQRFLTFKKLN